MALWGAKTRRQWSLAEQLLRIKTMVYPVTIEENRCGRLAHETEDAKLAPVFKAQARHTRQYAKQKVRVTIVDDDARLDTEPPKLRSR